MTVGLVSCLDNADSTAGSDPAEPSLRRHVAPEGATAVLHFRSFHGEAESLLTCVPTLPNLHYLYMIVGATVVGPDVWCEVSPRKPYRASSCKTRDCSTNGRVYINERYLPRSGLNRLQQNHLGSEALSREDSHNAPPAQGREQRGFST